MEWGDWSECADGIRTRGQVVGVEPVGAGTPCPTALLESEGQFKLFFTHLNVSICFSGLLNPLKISEEEYVNKKLLPRTYLILCSVTIFSLNQIPHHHKMHL